MPKNTYRVSNSFNPHVPWVVVITDLEEGHLIWLAAALIKRQVNAKFECTVAVVTRF